MIQCVPSLLHNNSARTQDTLHYLCYLLSSLSRRPYGLEVVQAKLDELGILYRPTTALSLPENDYSVVETLDDDEELNETP